MGFIGIDRGIEEHWIYQDAEYFKVWFEILLRARYSTEPETKMIEGKLITIEYAQFIFGRVSWSKKLNIGEQRIRTLFKKLQDENMIELSKTFHKFSIYTVINYAKYNHQSNHHKSLVYQGFEDKPNQHSIQQPTISQPSANQQLTTQEQSNKVNKVNKNKDMLEASFELFWSYYPEKKGKAKAFKKWMTYKDINIDEVLEGTKRYIEYCKSIKRYYMDGSTFVNNRSWQDDWSLTNTSISNLSQNYSSSPKEKEVEPYFGPNG